MKFLISQVIAWKNDPVPHAKAGKMDRPSLKSWNVTEPFIFLM